MASENGHVSLSAVDFLGLIKQRKVVRLDLSTVGYTGVIYVRDLTAAEQAHVSSGSGKGGKARFYSDKSYEMDLAALSEAAGPRFLEKAMVTDADDGALLERAFAAAGDSPYITMSEAELVQMADVWVREFGNRDRMQKALTATPNAITNLVVKTVRELSGMIEEGDRVEEKKRTPR